MPMQAKPQLEAATAYRNKKMPDFGGLKVFVLPGAFYGAVCALCAEAGLLKANRLDDADIVVFVGGEDINPALYGEAPDRSVHFTDDRDTFERLMFNRAKEQNKIMFGICRGAQFLHAMNGGKLWQDVNNHGGRNHTVIDVEDDVVLSVTSLHHQMLRDHPDLGIVAITTEQVADRLRCQERTVATQKALSSENPMYEVEIEAGYYTKSNCFFVQGHPEIGSPEYRAWTMNKLWDFYNEARDWMSDGPQDDPDITLVAEKLPPVPSALETAVTT